MSGSQHEADRKRMIASTWHNIASNGRNSKKFAAWDEGKRYVYKSGKTTPNVFKHADAKNPDLYGVARWLDDQLFFLYATEKKRSARKRFLASSEEAGGQNFTYASW